MQANIVLLPGDGIGPEVIAEARKVLETISSLYDHNFHFEEHLMYCLALWEVQNGMTPWRMFVLSRACSD